MYELGSLGLEEYRGEAVGMGNAAVVAAAIIQFYHRLVAE